MYIISYAQLFNSNFFFYKIIYIFPTVIFNEMDSLRFKHHAKTAHKKYQKFK